jgi:HD-like signal output (HDOD) protein
MSHVRVDDLQQGMILSEDVRDIKCRLLLSKGQEILSKHLRVLKIWGITEVDVVGTATEKTIDATERNPERMAHIQSLTDHVFKPVDVHHPALKEIYKAALVYRYQHHSGAQHPFPPRADSAVQPVPVPENLKIQIEKARIKLPEAPTLIAELNEVISDPFASTNDVAQIVNKSPSLSALLLKIANSAFYGFPSKIDRISRAVTIIGTKEIGALAMGICVMQAFGDIPAARVDMPSFIRHSLACGMIARIMAALKNIRQTEQMFVSGLLHDVGKLMILKYFPEPARAIMQLAAASGTSCYHFEKQVLGQRHTRVAKLLLHQWKLPSDLENNICFHHTPSMAKDPIKAGIIHMADLIVNALGIGTSGEASLPHFDVAAWEKIGISESTLSMVIPQAIHQLDAMEAIFQGIG